ncbi:MAG: hypothetical protein U0637_11225 [Phycisphaerales bacterium]
MGVRWVRRWVLMALVLAAPCVARAQEVIARDVYIDEHLVSVDDVEFLRDAAGLSAEQSEAAMSLLAGAKERLATARRRQERAERKMYQIEDEEAQRKEYRRYIERYVEDCATAEKEFMGDLRSLLTESQAGAWGRFERSRRRLLIRNTMNLERLDMVSLLRNALGASKGGGVIDGELASAVEQYEQEVDLLVQQRRPLAKLLGRSTAGWALGREEDAKADADCRAIAVRIMELNARTERVFGRALTEQQRDALDLRYIRAVWGETIPHFERDSEVADVLHARGLSAAQKEEVRGIIAGAEAQLLEACRTRMTKWEGLAVASVKGEDRGDDENFYATHVAKVQADVRGRVFGVLTAAQRAAYENGEDPLEAAVEEEDKDRRPDEY